jgi:Putative auto-transporter adhesin, head GIN domain
MKSFYIYLILVSVLIISCQKILFNDDESTREIILKDFHAVKISGIYNFVLIQDSTNRLVIMGKNDINSIDAMIKNDTPIIDDHKNISFNPNKNALTLHFSNLKYIDSSDPINLSNADTIQADQFSLVAGGEIAEVRLVFKCNHFYAVDNSNTLGYFHFIGKTETCWIWNRYGSIMYADSLHCKDAAIYNESVGNVNINASDNIDAFIRGPGNIGYYGTPVINIAEKRGTGKIIRLD